MHPASSLVTFGIAGLSLFVVSLLGLAIARTSRRDALSFGAVAATFLAFSGALAASGALAQSDAFPPRMLLVFLPTIGLPIALAASPIGKRLAEHTPLAWLVGFHAFRLPLELVMHVAAREGVMPPQMTFTGWNFDIVTGITALLVATLVAIDPSRRKLVAAWNALGSALLVAIAVIAIASLPQIHAFGTAPQQINTWVAYFPFVWLPAALVSSALLGHAILWRRLAIELRVATKDAVLIEGNAARRSEVGREARARGDTIAEREERRQLLR